MDYGFGVNFGGGNAGASTGDSLASTNTHCSNFFSKSAELLSEEMATMYAWIRSHGIDAETLGQMFIDYKNKYGLLNWQKEAEKWGGTRNYPVYNPATDIYGVKAWLTSRFTYLDGLYGYTAT
jgi:hypothetical protein